MSGPKNYGGFWGMRSGEALFELADFLSWKKEDWLDFEKWLDRLESGDHDPKRKKVPKRSDWRKTAQSLRRRNAIVTKHLGDRVQVRLTEKGWRSIQARRLRRADRLVPGKWCLVVFDFPESEHHARDHFRKFLQDAGFGQLQFSVFVSPRNTAPILCEVVDDLKIWSWVAIFEATLAKGRILFGKRE